jgi:DNA-binding NarL/FixJ family response regulator
VSTQPIKIEVVQPSIRQGKPLGRRERECLQGIFEGKRNLAIGASLGISEQMVKNYLRSAFQKLGIHDTRELFPLVIASGMELRGSKLTQ